MVIFYTMAYNAAQTLPRTIQSILNQTDPDWIWYLLDNGSQDMTGEIIRQYAEGDKRIIPLQNKKNLEFTPETSFTDLPNKHENSDWFSFLDADDTYATNFLSETLAFAAKYKLDVVACGSDFLDAATGRTRVQRIVQQDLLITSPEQFGICFPIYHQFMRTNWAKLFSIRVLKQLDLAKIPALYYGTDTLYTQEVLRHTERFGILAKSLHQYYIYPKSRSYQWDPSRFEADHILHKLACDFLTDKCGNISAQNRNFLQRVYSGAIKATLSVLYNSNLSPADKLQEYRTIASHPLTRSVYRECNDKNATDSRMMLLNSAAQAMEQISSKDDTDFRTIFQSLFPTCGEVVTGQNFSLFLKNPSLLQPLLRDDATLLMESLLTLIQKKQYGKKYNLLNVVQTLAINDPLLCQIGDAIFLRKYARLYLMVWRKEYLSALDEMTGMLLDEQVHHAQELFLNLYIGLSAKLEQVSAFIFGKIQLAQFYLSQKRKDECCVIIKELEEMGVDNKELVTFQQALESMEE